MKHYIFGGAGFLGQTLAKELLTRDQEVVIVDKKNSLNPLYSTIEIDITQPFSEWNIPIQPEDYVYHLAARQYHDSLPKKDIQQWFDEVNVLGTANVLEFLQLKRHKKLIYFSTDMVYGRPSQLPISEIAPLNPVGYYGKSKAKAEAICQAYRDKGMQITIFRPRLITGPGRLGVLTKLFKLIKRNLPVPLIGNGNNCYQMISVFDCVQAIILTTEQDFPNNTFNLGSDDPPSVYSLLSQLIKEGGSRSILLKTPASVVKLTLSLLERLNISPLYKDQYEIADIDYIVDTSKAKKLLGWQPQFNDQQMIFDAFQQYLVEEKK
jgi:nucleoside-diphosphate-sugar epimerase